MKTEEVIKLAKENFKDHVASFSQLNEYTQEVEFKKPGTCHYYVRFVMSGNYLFVCGDLGEAVYQLTQQARIDRIAGGYDLGYLTGKLRTGNKYTFDYDTAVEDIKEDMEEWEAEDLTDEIKKAYEDLIDLAQGCNTQEQWHIALAQNEDIADKISSEWWEWLPRAGEQLRTSIIFYWVALKMAGKQLGYEVKYFE